MSSYTPRFPGGGPLSLDSTKDFGHKGDVAYSVFLGSVLTLEKVIEEESGGSRRHCSYQGS